MEQEPVIREVFFDSFHKIIILLASSVILLFCTSIVGVWGLVVYPILLLLYERSILKICVDRDWLPPKIGNMGSWFINTTGYVLFFLLLLCFISIFGLIRILLIPIIIFLFWVFVGLFSISMLFCLINNYKAFCLNSTTTNWSVPKRLAALLFYPYGIFVLR